MGELPRRLRCPEIAELRNFDLNAVPRDIERGTKRRVSDILMRESKVAIGNGCACLYGGLSIMEITYCGNPQRS